MINSRLRKFLMILVLMTIGQQTSAQRFLTDLDSLLFIRDSVRPVIKRFENLRFSGYIQPQFQLAESKGAKTYEGGDFSTFSKSRFMLRRARVRIDYFIPSKENNWAKALFAFQLDGTERGVNIRDMFVRYYENRYHNFSATTGLFARPFGYEVNLSSAFREAPERGRMSQILMPSERDLGLMVSFEPQDRKHKLSFLKIDAGLFNGQGLSGTTDFDSRKDFISRITIKSLKKKNWEFSGGLSLLYGGWRQATKYEYETGTNLSGEKIFVVDSSLTNIGKIAPRHYYGADFQVALEHAWGVTELRSEYWRGTQPGSQTTSTNPGVLPFGPTYIRNFDGGFFCFLQNIINKKHQLIVKYDWYDPNTNISENEIGLNGNNFTAADIKFATLGLGYLFHMNSNMRLVFYQTIVRNKATQLPEFSGDIHDNVFTTRIHFRF